VADGFTKAIPTWQFEEFKYNLNLKNGCDWGGVLAIQILYRWHCHISVTWRDRHRLLGSFLTWCTIYVNRSDLTYKDQIVSISSFGCNLSCKHCIDRCPYINMKPMGVQPSFPETSSDHRVHVHTSVEINSKTYCTKRLVDILPAKSKSNSLGNLRHCSCRWTVYMIHMISGQWRGALRGWYPAKITAMGVGWYFG
jgi:hypothetical protein